VTQRDATRLMEIHSSAIHNAQYLMSVQFFQNSSMFIEYHASCDASRVQRAGCHKSTISVVSFKL